MNSEDAEFSMDSNSLHFSGWGKGAPENLIDELINRLKQYGQTKNIYQSYDKYYIDVHYTSSDSAQSAREYFTSNPKVVLGQQIINVKVQMIDSKNQEKQRIQQAQLQKYFEEMKDEEKAEFMLALRNMAMSNPQDCKYIIESYPVVGWLVERIYKK